jgi:hypothetical protein
MVGIDLREISSQDQARPREGLAFEVCRQFMPGRRHSRGAGSKFTRQDQCANAIGPSMPSRPPSVACSYSASLVVPSLLDASLRT